MNNYGHMTISEFARYTGIKRDNLIFYDKIGLITPELRSENGYRYYTQHQLPTAVLVSSMRELGISIQTIKDYTDQRTPQKMMTLFEHQKQKIDADIQKLQQLRDIMALYTDITAEALHKDITLIQVKYQPQEPVFFGSCLDETQLSSEENMNAFYDYAANHGMALSYPLGVIFSKENLLSGNLESPQQFYFKVSQSPDQFKPAGNYVIGYLQGAYSQTKSLYTRMLDFIASNHLVICGNAYEEYPLSEISVRNEDNYLIQVEIKVE